MGRSIEAHRDDSRIEPDDSTRSGPRPPSLHGSGAGPPRGVTTVKAAEGRFQVLESWRDRLFDGGRFLPPALVAQRRAIKETDLHLVQRVDLADGGVVFVKSYHPKGMMRFAAALLPRAGALGEWRHGLACHAAGIPCPEPLAAGRLADGLGATALVTGFLEGSCGLDVAAANPDLEPAARREVIAELGRLMRRMHEAGCTHDDVQLSNLMMTRRDGRIAVWIIDLKCMTRRDALPAADIRRNLLMMFNSVARLSSRADRGRFLRAYMGDVSREELARTAAELEALGHRRVAEVSRMRSDLAYMVSRRRLETMVSGAFRWHLRRGECGEEISAILADPAPILSSAPPDGPAEARGEDWILRREALVGPARPRRLLSLSAQLEYAGFRTRRILAVGEPRRGRRGRFGYVVSRDPKGQPLEAALAGADGPGRLDDVAALLARLHDMRISFGSLEPAHLSVAEDGATCLAETSGLRGEADATADADELAAFLQRLDLTAAAAERFTRRYTAARACKTLDAQRS